MGTIDLEVRVTIAVFEEGFCAGRLIAFAAAEAMVTLDFGEAPACGAGSPSTNPLLLAEKQRIATNAKCCNKRLMNQMPFDYVGVTGPGKVEFVEVTALYGRHCHVSRITIHDQPPLIGTSELANSTIISFIRGSVHMYRNGSVTSIMSTGT